MHDTSGLSPSLQTGIGLFYFLVMLMNVGFAMYQHYEQKNKLQTMIWGVGVILLVLTLLLSFTGYLLPWDQLAIWAITVGSNMARATPILGHEGPGAKALVIGGVDLIHSGSDARFLLLGARFVGEATLLRFYVLHCVALPLAAALLIAVHFWRVRKDGGISGAL